MSSSTSNKTSLNLTIKGKEEAKIDFDNLLIELKDCFDIEKINRRIANVSGGHLNWTQKVDHIEEIDVFRIVTDYPGIAPLNSMTAETFSFPPSPKNFGRAHIPKFPVFYGALNVKTAIEESRIKNGEEFYLSHWVILPNQNLHAHYQCFDSNGTGGVFYERILDQLTEAFKNVPDTAFEALMYTQKRVTDLFKLNSEKNYNITSAIAHNLLYQLRNSIVDTPILFYSSILGGKDDYCLAIHPSLASDKSRFKLKSVLKCKLKKDNKIEVICRGVEVENLIRWKKLKLTLNWVDRNKVIMVSNKGARSIVTNQSYLYLNGIKENVLLLLEKNYGHNFEEYILEKMKLDDDLNGFLKNDIIQKTELIHCPIEKGILKIENEEVINKFIIRISYTLSWID
ncbi:MAG: RES family NAD+ phosphorylase [Crocinitomicaceae bacterium]|jgi:hypothetical protein|nr:RES family NAD+ phosphorylase [Crocinitomicaceae bacterium]